MDEAKLYGGSLKIVDAVAFMTLNQMRLEPYRKPAKSGSGKKQNRAWSSKRW